MHRTCGRGGVCLWCFIVAFVYRKNVVLIYSFAYCCFPRWLDSCFAECTMLKMLCERFSVKNQRIVQCVRSRVHTLGSMSMRTVIRAITLLYLVFQVPHCLFSLASRNVLCTVLHPAQLLIYMDVVCSPRWLLYVVLYLVLHTYHGGLVTFVIILFIYTFGFGGVDIYFWVSVLHKFSKWIKILWLWMCFWPNGSHNKLHVVLYICRNVLFLLM